MILLNFIFSIIIIVVIIYYIRVINKKEDKKKIIDTNNSCKKEYVFDKIKKECVKNIIPTNEPILINKHTKNPTIKPTIIPETIKNKLESSFEEIDYVIKPIDLDCIDESDCNYSGSCIQNKCKCNNNYSGTNCETDLCANINCNNGTCENGICKCFEYWLTDSTGICNINQKEQLCPPNKCGNNENRGLCSIGSDTVSDGSCICKNGWFGDKCQNHYCKTLTDKNGITTIEEKCKNNSFCDSSNGSCICNVKYDQFNNPIIKNNSYKKNKNLYFKGPTCEINDCLNSDGTYKCNNGTCDINNGDCTCNFGFVTDKNYNECNKNMCEDCGIHGTCVKVDKKIITQKSKIDSTKKPITNQTQKPLIKQTDKPVVKTTEQPSLEINENFTNAEEDTYECVCDEGWYKDDQGKCNLNPCLKKNEDGVYLKNQTTDSYIPICNSERAECILNDDNTFKECFCKKELVDSNKPGWPKFFNESENQNFTPSLEFRYQKYSNFDKSNKTFKEQDCDICRGNMQGDNCSTIECSFDDANYHVDIVDKVCKINICNKPANCKMAASGGSSDINQQYWCKNHNSEQCEFNECNDGYYYVDEQCFNSSNDEVECTDESSVKNKFGHCKINKCVCPNGVNSEGIKCPLDGSHKCESCKPGFYKYYYSNQDYIDKQFYCENEQKCVDNGGFIDGDECKRPESHLCKRILNDSELTTGSLIYNTELSTIPTCSCNEGFTGKLCHLCDGDGDSSSIQCHNRCEAQHENIRACPSHAVCRLDENYYSYCDCNCKNNGTCNRETGMCTCQHERYSGNDCSIDECSNNKCGQDDAVPRGTCNNDGSCSCNDPFEGDTCQFNRCKVNKEINGDDKCKNGSTCNIDNGTCSCVDPYHGPTCEINRCSHNCSGNGTCNVANGSCSCNNPWHGNVCQHNRCSHNCSGHGTCNVANGNCSCDNGYHETNNNKACTINTCRCPGGTKVDDGPSCSTHNQIKCKSCGTGFKLDNSRCKCNKDKFKDTWDECKTCKGDLTFSNGQCTCPSSCTSKSRGTCHSLFDYNCMCDYGHNTSCAEYHKENYCHVHFFVCLEEKQRNTSRCKQYNRSYTGSTDDYDTC